MIINQMNSSQIGIKKDIIPKKDIYKKFSKKKKQKKTLIKKKNSDFYIK